MVKICVQSPEVAMHGEINIHAQVSVVTKAKLDSVAVQGACQCDDVKKITDYVILIDGSDSYNNKVVMDGKVAEGEAFEQTKNWTAGLIKNLANSRNAELTTVSVVQFSGIKPLEKTYKPGSNGDTGSAGLYHYRIQVEPTKLSNVSSIVRNTTDFDALDGNGQLFLCLQDLAMDGFVNKVRDALPGPDRETVIIVVSDEEWDVKNLENAFGSGKATGESVCAAIHQKYSQVFAVVVRPNKFNDQNEDFIVNKLCNGRSSNYKRVYTENFEKDMNRAGYEILRQLGYDGKTFF